MQFRSNHGNTFSFPGLVVQLLSGVVCFGCFLPSVSSSSFFSPLMKFFRRDGGVFWVSLHNEAPASEMQTHQDVSEFIRALRRASRRQ